PCHQSTFDVTEHCKVISGPAKRPLPQLPISVDSEGYLVAQSDFPEPVGPTFWESNHSRVLHNQPPPSGRQRTSPKPASGHPSWCASSGARSSPPTGRSCSVRLLSTASSSLFCRERSSRSSSSPPWARCTTKVLGCR